MKSTADSITITSSLSVSNMGDAINSIDELRLREAFQQPHRPFDECWTVRMDTTLLVIDDDDTHATRFSDNPDDEEEL